MNSSNPERPRLNLSLHGRTRRLNNPLASQRDGVCPTYSSGTVGARASWKLWQKELPEASVAPSDEKSFEASLDRYSRANKRMMPQRK